MKSYIKRYIFRYRNKYIPVHCVNISHIDVVLLFRGERKRISTYYTSPIVDLVSRRSLFLLFYIRDRENGSRASFSSRGNFAGSVFCVGIANFQMGTRARVFFEGYNGTFRFSEKGTLSDVSRSSGTVPAALWSVRFGPSPHYNYIIAK